MSEVNLFEVAARNGYRYPSVKGLLSTEDLYSLPLTSTTGFSLDDVAMQLDEIVEKSSTKSFVASPAKVDQDAVNKLAIVVHVIDTKKRENAARLDAKAKRQRKAKLAEALAKLDDKELDTASREELMAEYDSL